MSAIRTVQKIASRARSVSDDRGEDVGERLSRRAAAGASEVLAGAEKAMDAADPKLRRAGEGVGALLRAVLRLAAVVPQVLARVLDMVAGTLGRMAETGREVADQIEPPTGARRRRRLVLAGWFAGGFAAGVATGWVLREQLGDEHHAPPGPRAVPDPADEGDDAADAWHARR